MARMLTSSHGPSENDGPSIPPSMESHLSDLAISLKSFVSMRCFISLPISQCIPDVMAILWFPQPF